MNTPLIRANEIPERRPGYSTSGAYTKLVRERGAMGRRPCTCTQHTYWLWKHRTEEEMEEARTQGRWIVYERMRRLNPERVKKE